jgi:hypothetical protein
MDIILGAIVLAILVALHLFMIVVVHQARMANAEPRVTDDRTRAVWESGG